MNLFAKTKCLVSMVLVAFTCLSILQGFRNAVVKEDGSKDYQWSGSRLLLEQQNPYTTYLDPEASEAFILAQAPNYPPSGLLMLWPYAAQDWSVAKTLWAMSNLIFSLVILRLILGYFPEGTSIMTKVVLITLFLMGTPWRNGMGNGQHTLFTLAFFLLATALYAKSSKFAGIPLAVSWFKYTIAFPLTLFFARSGRGLIAIVVAGSIHVVLTLFLGFWTGSSPLDLLSGPLQVAQSATGNGYVDVFAVAYRLGIESSLPSVIGALLILAVTFFSLRYDTDDLSCLSTLALVSIVVVFHLPYDLAVLVLPFSYALRSGLNNIRSFSYCMLIAVAWFLDKIFWVANGKGLIPAFDTVEAVYFWIKVILFYGALIIDWIMAYKRYPSMSARN